MKLAHLFTLFLLATALPTLAEWEPRGLCYVWTGDGKPDSPGDMLTGEIYDYNLSKEGKHFTYSEIYYPDELFTEKQLDVATEQRFRKSKQKFRTGCWPPRQTIQPTVRISVVIIYPRSKK